MSLHISLPYKYSQHIARRESPGRARQINIQCQQSPWHTDMVRVTNNVWNLRERNYYYSPSRSTISQSLRENSREKDESQSTMTHLVTSSAVLVLYLWSSAQGPITHWEAERAKSAVRSRGSCGLFIVTIIKSNARMYILYRSYRG
jgi:hypothetical protein